MNWFKNVIVVGTVFGKKYLACPFFIMYTCKKNTMFFI